jgi:hypothetical protein
VVVGYLEGKSTRRPRPTSPGSSADTGPLRSSNVRGVEVSSGSAGGDAACAKSLIDGVAEAVRGAGGELDHVVDAFAFGVAVAGGDEGGYLGPPAVDGAGEGEQVTRSFLGDPRGEGGSCRCSRCR